MGPRAAQWTRRAALLGGMSAALAACGRKIDDGGPVGSLEWAVAGDWRGEAAMARDGFRHPLETLRFFGLKPRMTVVEFWPGAGWYTDIIAPYQSRNSGKLYAAMFEADSAEPAAKQVNDAYRRRFRSRRRYGRIEFTTFGPTSGPVAPAGEADLVLFLRNLHNWMAAGIAEKAFRDAFAALKPGGLLGIEEHRASPADAQDPLAVNGYVQQSYAVRLAQDAGFVLQAASEINANPRDDKDHPFGVWTLPPTRLTAPRGQPANAAFNRAPYDAIGESDRMTLRFVKPA